MPFTRNLSALTSAAPLLILGLALAAPGQAQCLSDRLSSSDGNGGDIFGRSISASGNDLIVGASRDDDGGGVSTGSVYHYTLTPSGYVEDGKWNAFDPAQQDEFGEAVDIDGDWAVVGARNADVNGTNSGAAYVFQRVGGTWVAGPKLVGSLTDDNDLFGTSVAVVDGPTPRIAVGAPWHGIPAGFSTGGAVYIYEYDAGAGVWNEVEFMRPGSVNLGDFFGAQVSMDGGRLAVSATADDNQFTNAGVVYVFDHDGNSFVEMAQLQPSDVSAFINFGFQLDLEGDWLVAVGWKAYVFQLQGGTWTEDAILVGAGAPPATNDSIAISDGRVVVGEYTVGSGGGAWFFERMAGTWVETGMPLAFTAGDFFGRAAEIVNGVALISADSANVNGTGMTVGEVYAYPLTGDDCNNNGVFDACDIYSGTSSDNDGDGVPDECGGGGGVFNYCSSTPNSSGFAAVISMQGSTSASANDFTLVAGPVPQQFGLFFYGPQQTDLPLGNGRLCVTGGLSRMPATFPTPGGVLQFSLDLASPPAGGAVITAGSTWYFQAWFRDTVGAGNDLSDGLAVTFSN
jgi:FG-GAP repeat